MRFSSLRCFFFAIRLRRFLMTEPTDVTSRSRDVIVVPDLITRRRLSPDNSRMLPGHDRQMRVCGLFVPGAIICALSLSTGTATGFDRLSPHSVVS